MIRIILPVLILVAVSFRADASIDECAGVDADLDRLACYDRESGRTPKTEAKAPVGEWDVSVKTSDFEDTTDVFLRVQSDDVVRCGRIKEPETATLLIRCMENTTALYISTACHLTSSDYNDYGHVDVRLDEAPAKVIRMDESTNNNSLGLWSGGKAIPFIKTMLDKDVMLTRFTPYGESAVTAKFQIAGLKEAISPLRESCGW